MTGAAEGGVHARELNSRLPSFNIKHLVSERSYNTDSKKGETLQSASRRQDNSELQINSASYWDALVPPTASVEPTGKTNLGSKTRNVLEIPPSVRA